jgi:hypothetical protein
MGRFAIEYRQRFGEKPSETLSSASRPGSALLRSERGPALR